MPSPHGSGVSPSPTRSDDSTPEPTCGGADRHEPSICRTDRNGNGPTRSCSEKADPTTSPASSTDSCCVDAWPDLVLPNELRAAWQPLIDETLEQQSTAGGRGMNTLDPDQLEVARILFALPSATGFALAGGSALLLSGTIERPTRDIDAFIAARPGIHHGNVQPLAR